LGKKRKKKYFGLFFQKIWDNLNSAFLREKLMDSAVLGRTMRTKTRGESEKTIEMKGL